MKRISIAATAVCVALTIPVAATAKSAADYAGTFAPSGTVGFTVKKTNKGKKVLNFHFGQVPMSCGGSPETTSGDITFGIKVKKNKFHTDAVAGNPQNPDAELNLKGKLDGALASGTMRVHGSKVFIDGGGSGNCDTTTLNWSAEKL